MTESTSLSSRRFQTSTCAPPYDAALREKLEQERVAAAAAADAARKARERADSLEDDVTQLEAETTAEDNSFWRRIIPFHSRRVWKTLTTKK